MRRAALVALALVPALAVGARPARAEVTSPYRLEIDGALGGDPPSVITDNAVKPLTACFDKTRASGSALVWLEVAASGAVTGAKVRGTGAAALDACIATALKKARVEAPPGPLVVLGRLLALDVAKQDSTAYFAPPRISTVAVMLDAGGAAWQLGAKRIGYTANRAADIAQALAAQAPAIATCATRRAKRLAPANLVAWHDGGKAVVRGSGDAAYDACVAKVVSAIKLPTEASALWMELELRQPGEPLAPRGTTHGQAVRDALRDAVKTRKTELATCLDKHPQAKLGTLTVALRAGKVAVTAIATGDAAVDACVRDKLAQVTVPRAVDGDTAEATVDLE